MSDRRLARFVQPVMTEARLARQWEDVEPRSLRWRLPRHLVPVLATLASFALLLGVVLHGRSHASRNAMEGAVLESEGVTLADGTHVAVGEAGRMRVITVREDAVELALDVGAMDLTVPHGPRRLVVHTPRYDVIDLGTRFRVTLDAQGELRIDVAEGSVEVRSHDGKVPARRLDAGESWTDAPILAAPAPLSSSSTMAPAIDSSTIPAASSPDGNAGPRDLLATAERARLAGHTRAAAAALDTLRRRFRSDPRAALGAFELGRLRLDSLGDAPGAVEAFSDAIVLSPRGPLREDAEARRVEALAAERSRECAAARDAFLARYPRSAHATLVAGQCPAE
jgi:transmembrane sensor